MNDNDDFVNKIIVKLDGIVNDNNLKNVYAKTNTSDVKHDHSKYII